jgi:hypothetical protein
MAISRAQLLKELLPGLNALFGLEYALTVNNTKRFLKLKPLSVRLKKKQNCRAFLLRRSKTKVLPSLLITHKKRFLLDTTTKPLH